MTEDSTPFGHAPGEPDPGSPAPPLPPGAPIPPVPPAPPGWGAPPPYGAPAPTFVRPEPAATNGVATAALVVGIVAIPMLVLCGLGAIAGLVAVVLGVLGLVRAGKLPDSPGKGMAIGGLIIGVVSLIAGVAIFAAFLAGWSSEVDTDPVDGYCDVSRYLQDPDCD